MFGIPWHRLPVFLGLLKLTQIRNQLRRNNLHDTSQLADTDKLPHPASPSLDEGYLTARTADGSYNDLAHPEMGMAGTRFGRNVPLQDAEVDETNLLIPNPRVVSRRLLARKEFKPATFLNLLAAGWIQFETHDWFSHGNNQPDHKINIPLSQDDLWEQEHHQPLAIDKTLEDPTRTNAKANPPTFINHETHWWDASQVYGSNQEKINELRSHVDGKMNVGENGLIPIDPATGFDRVGNPGTWWLAMGLLHTLFVKEHNLVCDQLKKQHVDWTDDQLFDHARLIVAAITAKIHTVEWTPAILPNPITKKALETNWWGLFGPDFKRIFGRIGNSEIISGILGSATDHHTAPYYLTEEFTSVYRMHPLVRDEYEFYSVGTGNLIQENNLFDLVGKRARSLMESIPMPDLWYSFGIMNPGAVTLHNYPYFLRQLVKDNGEVFDLAAVDILRDRERGVPRYNRFRELLGRGRVKSFEEITSNLQWAKELREIYHDDVDSVDLMVGLYAEDLPEGFGFSETAFRVFILMASRRLNSDRFFTNDYRAEIYTQFGLDWIDQTTLSTLLLRHYPELASALRGVENPFAPWKKINARA